MQINALNLCRLCMAGIAIGASVGQAVFSLVALGFFGPPIDGNERMMLALSGSLWIPALFSWKFPLAGLLVFLALLGAAIFSCSNRVGFYRSGWYGCVYDIKLALISAIFLLASSIMAKYPFDNKGGR